jgi:hypothetical protein
LVGLEHAGHAAILQTIFTEGRQGNEESGAFLRQISKKTPFLPSMVVIKRLFAIFCSNQNRLMGVIRFLCELAG